ncbi:meiosis-specific protein ASY2-like [Eutrema salsugineum]|uniref:meiosis-specific protein ASY2-like n=1 Tax=Eutrema salsugineum TaxID=72664 RepID=UPI000CED0688|nr:meiosis-specific protein ASY2-like [Eutrema salsugineum]
MPKRKVIRPRDVPASSLSPTIIQTVLETHGLTDGAVVIIPDTGDRPWDIPEDFLCIYLTYFTQCELTFPIPSRLFRYCKRQSVALLQMMPASVTNYTGFQTLCAELNEDPSNRLFEDVFSINLHKSKECFFAANAKPRRDIVIGVKPSKYNDWESQYFFLEINELTVTGVDIPTQSEWKIPIGRHLPSFLLNSALTPEFQAAFSEVGKRRWPEAWEEILECRAKKSVSVKEPKPLKPKSRAKKPHPPPRRKAAKPKKKHSTMLLLDEIPNLFDDVEPNDAAQNLLPTTEGDEQRDEEMALERAAELNPSIPTASELAIPEEQAEATNKRKRQERDRGEQSPESEPAKGAKVCFDYDDEGPLEDNIDACANLYHKISSEVPSLPKIPELRFSNLYKGIAHTNAVLASQTNTLVEGYEVALFDEQMRVAELEDKISKVDDRLATELRINDELHNAVDLLKQESSELKAIKAELMEAQALLSREFKQDKERLQGMVALWRDRARKLTGVLGFIKKLKNKGLYEVPAEMVAKLKAKHAEALKEYHSVDAYVLTEEDKRMSPLPEANEEAPADNPIGGRQDQARVEQFGSNEDMINADQTAVAKTA